MRDRRRGHDGTIGERLEHDLAAFQKPLPGPYDACDKKPGSVNLLSLVRYRLNDYLVPTAYGHQAVLVRGYVHEVIIACGTEVIARHGRSYEREDFVFNPLHYHRAGTQWARPGSAARRLEVARGVRNAAPPA